MIEQWFLDLDGTRSGPYHTPEIMTLIAEGEVLPHHRISVSLKDQPWITVLHWRLDQAKISQAATPAPSFRGEGFETPQLSTPPEIAPQIPASTITTSPLTPASPAFPHAAPRTAPVTPLAPLPEEDQPIFTFVPDAEQKESLLSDFKMEEPAATLESLSHSIEPPALHPPQQTSSKKKRAKRDPMAEMFDMLQNTKHKKESKQMASPPLDMSIKADTPDEIGPKGGIAKTLGIGAGIIIIGFALGQLFQNAAPPKTQVGSTQAPPVKDSGNPEGAAKETTTVIDRSTDKLTIRANVERHLEVATPPPSAPAAKYPPKAIVRAPPPDPVQSEKEIEELKSLKKELQELKALKSSGNPGDEPNEGVLDPGDGQGLDPNANFDPNYQGPNSGTGPSGGPQNGDLPPVVR